MPLIDSRTGQMRLEAGQYIAYSLPVVALPVGINTEIVTDGETGFLATGPGERYAAMRRLSDVRDEGRRSMTRAA